jgi:hypothetical protein
MSIKFYLKLILIFNKILIKIKTIIIMVKKILIFILSIFSLIDKSLNQISSECERKIAPKVYSDCEQFNQLQNSKICCFIRGVYGENNGTACILVNDLFSNKSVSLTKGDSTSTMICGSDILYSNYIKINIFSIILYILFLLI